MATNKHATIRYHALDQCFSNSGRRYYVEDLIEACNDALFEFTGTSEGIKRRQIFEDIKFMESEQGWSIPLERIKDGKRVYYRYDDKGFSIKKQVVNETEAKQIKEALTVLTKFKGMPQFDWMEEMLVRIESSFNLKGKNQSIVGFENNPYLKGLNFFTDIFNAIDNKTVLEIKYKGFKQTEPVMIVLHPYFLKQYNSRWFLFGMSEEIGSISNLALDRIVDLKEKHRKYIGNDIVDFDEYFEEVVGVTVDQNRKSEKIILQISSKLWPYIETKPIHGSQKIKVRTEKHTLIELDLQINFEFLSLIFSFGEEAKIISPKELGIVIQNKAKALLKQYK